MDNVDDVGGDDDLTNDDKNINDDDDDDIDDDNKYKEKFDCAGVKLHLVVE